MERSSRLALSWVNGVWVEGYSQVVGRSLIEHAGPLVDPATSTNQCARSCTATGHIDLGHIQPWSPLPWRWPTTPLARVLPRLSPLLQELLHRPVEHAEEDARSRSRWRDFLLPSAVDLRKRCSVAEEAQVTSPIVPRWATSAQHAVQEGARPSRRSKRRCRSLHPRPAQARQQTIP